MSVKSKMTAIADRIRVMLGISSKMGLDAMANHLGTAQNEVDTQADLIDQLRLTLQDKAAGIIPSGDIVLDENGIYDVAQYANAVVNVFAGEYTASSNQSGDLKINHGLDETPNFYLFYADASEAGSGQNETILKMAIAEPCSNRPVVEVALTYNNYGQLAANYGTSTGSASYFNSTEILIDGTRAPVKAGSKYHWIAGVIAGLS